MATRTKTVTVNNTSSRDIANGELSLRKYSWDEVHKHNKAEDCWMVVKGKVYDVTKWVPNHPGGNLIVQGAGRESTGMFQSYHPLHVESMLKKYEIGVVSDYNPYYKWESDFYTTMKTRVEAHLKAKGIRGFGSTRVILKSLFIVMGWCIFYNLAMIRGNIWAAVILGIFHAHFGISIQHDGNHGAFSSNKTISRIAGLAMDFMGGSSLVWVHQHNVGHHPYANREGGFYNEDYDPDATSAYPLVRTHPNQKWKYHHQFQHIFLWFLIGFSGLKWAFNDVKWLLKRRYNDIQFYEIPNREKLLMLIAKSIFIGYAFVVPLYLHNFIHAITLILTFSLMNGNLFILNFAVNHLLEENAFPDKTWEERDWAKLQVLTSSNYATGSTFWTSFSGGLNHQIEHHLFPYVSHVYLAEVQPIVEKTCKEYNVHYTNKPTYWGALSSYYNFLKAMGQPPKQQ